MQVALHALPEQARSQSAEMAGTVYRQMQDMGQAREQNLIRPSQVMQNQAAMESQNPAIRREDARYLDHRSRRSPEEKRGMDSSSSTVYENMGWRHKPHVVESMYFDRTA